MGRTDQHWSSLHDAGRLDIVYECIVTSLFLSHGLRRDVIFNATLSGPPNPPVHLRIDGAQLYDVRTDQETWYTIIKKMLSNKTHPGITATKTSFEALLKAKAQTAQVYVLEEGGKDINDVEIDLNPLFVLGDHVGLPKKTETYALRFGEKISLGKVPYLAASCINILNFLIDQQNSSNNEKARQETQTDAENQEDSETNPQN
jgi:tRNA (pseudouridine54-N1)-methyltransferase